MDEINMNIYTECKHCETILESSQECMGKSYHCPNCDKIVKIPKNLDEHLKIIKRANNAERIEKENEFVNLIIKGFVSSLKWIVGVVIVIGMAICGIMIAHNNGVAVEGIFGTAVMLLLATCTIVAIVWICDNMTWVNPPTVEQQEKYLERLNEFTKCIRFLSYEEISHEHVTDLISHSKTLKKTIDYCWCNFPNSGLIEKLTEYRDNIYKVINDRLETLCDIEISKLTTKDIWALRYYGLY